MIVIALKAIKTEIFHIFLLGIQANKNRNEMSNVIEYFVVQIFVNNMYLLHAKTYIHAHTERFMKQISMIFL